MFNLTNVVAVEYIETRCFLNDKVTSIFSAQSCLLCAVIKVVRVQVTLKDLEMI